MAHYRALSIGGGDFTPLASIVGSHRHWDPKQRVRAFSARWTRARAARGEVRATLGALK